VAYCRFSIAFTGAVLDLSVDLPLAKAERPNLDLDADRSRALLGGGGGKFIGASPRPLIDKGEMTVIALVGVATSLGRFEGVRALVCKCCRCGGDRAFSAWFAFETSFGVYGGGGDSSGSVSTKC
jgi:hypothetical protein